MITPKQIIERLYQIKENPGIYKSLSAEEQADILLFILTPKPLLKKTATVKLEKGERGLPGIDGTNSLTEAQQTAILADLVGKIKIEHGKDAEVTTAMLEGIVAEVISRIELPDLEQVVTTTITAEPTAIRNSLELLNDEERLAQSAIENLPEDLQKIRDAIVALPRGGNGIGKNQVYNFIREAVADGTIPAGGGGGAGISDGDKGDIVVTATGATWTIDAGVVTAAKTSDGVQTSLGKADSASQPGHTHDAVDITDFNEAAQDAVLGIFTNNGGVEIQYDDVNNSAQIVILDNAVQPQKISLANGASVLGKSQTGAGQAEEIDIIANSVLGRGPTGDVLALILGAGLTVTDTEISVSSGLSQPQIMARLSIGF